MNSEVALLILSLPLSAGVLLSRVRVRQSLFLSFLSFLVSETTMDEVVLATRIGTILSGSLASNQDVGVRREGAHCKNCGVTVTLFGVNNCGIVMVTATMFTPFRVTVIL